MSDIAAYESPSDYNKYQSLRPDYDQAISTALSLAKKYAKNKKLVLADFCCGTGSNTKKFSSMVILEKALLIDINQKFLEAARKSIKLNNVEIHCGSVLDISLKKECDMVFSLFAYHHIEDKKKELYLKQIESCLKKNGIVIVTEIYLDREEVRKYYKGLLGSMTKKSKGVVEFIDQTAGSRDFEFKVSKSYAEKQFLKKFEILEEIKIWPKDRSDSGTFVQVLKLK